MHTPTDTGVRNSGQDARLDDLHNKLATEVDNLVTSADWTRALETAARFRAYSAANSLLIWVQYTDAYAKGLVPHPVPTFVAGVRGWNSLGRTVIRGQKGLQIRLPVLGRFAAASPDAGEDTWRRLAHWEKLRPGEVLKKKLVSTKVGRVFDVAQTEGRSLETFPEPVLLEGEAPVGLWDGVAVQITGRGFTLRRVDSAREIHGANGLTDYAARVVSVRTDMDPAAQAKSLIHELGHVMLHGPGNADSSSHRGIGEVEAESIALLVGAAHGMDTSQYTVPYVATWASGVPDKDEVDVVLGTLDRVRKTASRILDDLDTTQISNGLPPGLDRDSLAAQHAAKRGAAKAAHHEHAQTTRETVVL
ncbi:serine/arginine repetitive matrix protein 2 [Georgenia subflava]|uniref:Serine/arginine repetitive matrix protein 2 n=2 Tax=Georgenia subflava TaxID=1622177 RepID=A0A6N7EIE4_9MICO|nr:serine/arginine repetitive matrix protein 2 [Georgenia subflava]